LTFVYIGLGYLGKASGELFPNTITRTDLIMNIANDFLPGFAWILPAILGAILGSFIKPKKYDIAL
jgi:branched-subunit amino acid permease